MAGLLAASASARPLTPAEKQVCSSAKMCADVVVRHRPSQFDYDVLAREFERLSPAATRQLVRVATPAQLGNLERLSERTRPEIAVEMGLLLQTRREPEARSLGRHILRSERLQTVKLAGQPPVALPILKDLAASDPAPLTVRMLRQHDFQAARPALVAALGSSDADTVGLAYRALFDDNPQAAFEALVAQMRATRELGPAVALGRMIAERDAGRPDGFYGRMLDDIAGDLGYSESMRDGARAGSFALSRPDAPMSASADLPAQITRLYAADALNARAAFRRADAAVRYAFSQAAQGSPDLLADTLPELARMSVPEAERDRWIEMALDQPARGRTLDTALAMIPLHAVDRWAARLEPLARSHPFDTVRGAAAAKLDRNPAAPDIRLVRSRAGKARYCVDGRRRSPRPDFALMPTFEEEQTGLPDGAAVRRRAQTTSYPGRTRWLAGYADGGDGSLVAFDYADGKASVLDTAPVDWLLPNRVPDMGQQPDWLWVIGDGRYGRIAPDGATSVEAMGDLPAPVRDVFRLKDGGLLLHFHDAKAPFQPRVTDSGVLPGWVDSPPPLLLTPDGALQPGCRGEALAGGRPDATP